MAPGGTTPADEMQIVMLQPAAAVVPSILPQLEANFMEVRDGTRWYHPGG